MYYELEDTIQQATIKVVGVGGAGGNAVDTMIQRGLDGVECIVVNTDAQALNKKLAPRKVQIGVESTKGLGSGANPEVGRAAAEEDVDRIREALEGADMVFITAGMGKGTGTGAAPVVARVAKELDALTVAVVTRPFSIEGRVRQRIAEEGIQQLVDVVDTLITISNDKLLEVAGKSLGVRDAYRLVDYVLYQSVRGISDIITYTGEINVDFADVRTVMANRGMAVMGTGEAEGEDRAVEAAEAAINNPMLEGYDIEGATAVLINVTHSGNCAFHDLYKAFEEITRRVPEEANIIQGVAEDPSLGDRIRVTVLATGFQQLPVGTKNPALRTIPGGAAVAEATRTGDGTGDLVYEDELDRPAFLRRARRR